MANTSVSPQYTFQKRVEGPKQFNPAPLEVPTISENPQPEKSFGGKLMDTVGAIGSSIDIDAGIGIGAKASVELYGIGFDAGVRADLFTIKYGNGNFEFGSEYDSCAMATFFSWELGPHESQFENHIKNEVYPKEYSTFKDTGAITIFGTEAYLPVFGAHYTVDFNYKNFQEKWDQIWN